MHPPETPGSPGRRPTRALWKHVLLLAALALQLSGCAAAAPQALERDARAEILAGAHAMLGRPYRYGGASPRGFDCSGLVYYTYSRAGIRVPRTTAEQFLQAKRVGRRQLRPGDLLFFRLGSRRVSHVAIYKGAGEFIHAPSTGKHVMTGSLEDRYWRERFAGGGRLLTPSAVRAHVRP
jgi:murein DD-endopeptidase